MHWYREKRVKNISGYVGVWRVVCGCVEGGGCVMHWYGEKRVKNISGYVGVWKVVCGCVEEEGECGCVEGGVGRRAVMSGGCAVCEECDALVQAVLPQAIPDAYVPVIKLEFEGIEVSADCLSATPPFHPRPRPPRPRSPPDGPVVCTPGPACRP